MVQGGIGSSFLISFRSLLSRYCVLGKQSPPTKMAAAAAPSGALAVATEAGEANRAFEEGAVTLEDIQRFTVRDYAV